MPSRVPPEPSPSILRRCAVGRPVSAAIGGRWADELAFLLATNLPVVAGSTTSPTALVAPEVYNVAYSRTAGCRVVRVGVELGAAAPGSSVTLLFNAALIGAAWLGETDLDGGDPVPSPLESLHAYSEDAVGYLDVSSVTVGTIVDITIVCTSSTGTPVGVRKISVVEVPVGYLDAVGEPTHVGVDGAWPFLGRYLEDGSAADPRGFVRCIAEIDKARAKVPRHWQLVMGQSVAASTTTVAPAYGSMFFGGAFGNPKFYMRARDLYDDGSPNLYTFRPRYITSGVAANLKVTVNGAATVFPLPAAAVWTPLPAAINMPTGAADQLCEITFEGNVAAAGTLSVETFAFIEAEV